MLTHSDEKRNDLSWKFHLLRSAILTVVLMIILNCQAQQYQVTVTIAVPPPYTQRVNDYIAQPNKIMATLVNSSDHQMNVSLQGSISGTGQIKIFTDPGWKMPQPVVLQPGIPFHLTRQNLEQVFNADHLIYQGITKDEIVYGSGLPEDDYVICLRVFDYQTNIPLSMDSPQGCSNIINVTNVEPSVILQQTCGSEVPVSTPQNIVFSWTRPPGAPVNALFKLKFVEVLPTDRNINDAMQSATHPVFFETTLQTTSYILGPADPQLVPGKKYAFAVTVSDPENKVVFRNHGMSGYAVFFMAIRVNSRLRSHCSPRKTEAR